MEGGRELEASVSPLISLQQRDHQRQEFSTGIPTATWSATPVQMISGMSASTSNVDYLLSGANNNYAAWKAAKYLAPLMSPEKDEGLDFSPFMSLEQRYQGLDVSPLIDPFTAILADTSGVTSDPLISFNTGIALPASSSRTYMSAAADIGIASSSAVHYCSNPADRIQDVAIPTSNPSSMPVEMESSGGVVNVQDDRLLMQYPLRYTPDCVLLKPVPGANTHPAYIWKGYH